MKKILGLDLGTTSIGWAFVKEAENEIEKSEIIKTGVRVIPLTTDESTDFTKGKALSINADRTLKRGARKCLQRYKLRRQYLLTSLIENSIIDNDFVLGEKGKKSTFKTLEIRARAASEKIPLQDFAKVLLTINKKRGYKSNRKANSTEDGQAIDSMDVALKLYEKHITPGQYVLSLLKEDKKFVPDFYRSDLQNEFDKIWEFQHKFYPTILTNELKEKLIDQKKGATYKICEEPFSLVGIKRIGKQKDLKLENYQWRVNGLSEKLDLEQLVVVLQEINGQKNNSSGYLGKISDRSKELHLKNETVGQYLYKQIKENPHVRLKNQVFYRQDYLDEFEKIWETQAKFHKELTNELKLKLRDIIIFYQRRLKSQKGLISICELEGKEIEIEVDGKRKKKFVGPRVIPKSSPLFQEFKIWQILNNLEIRNTITKEVFVFSEETKIELFEALNLKGKLKNNEVLKLIVNKPKEWELNYKEDIEGNNTNELLLKAYIEIAHISGHDEINFEKLKANQLKKVLKEIFTTIGINTDILEFNAELEEKECENQPSYQLWHLLYSYEGDNSVTGNEKLYQHLKQKFGFEKEYAKALINISFKDDYGSLSAKAIKKIMPYLQAGHPYSNKEGGKKGGACEMAGYNPSKALTKEENEKRVLKNVIDLLPKNSLRNPVVEKILNQMAHVVNGVVAKYGRPDEIRVELARELKKSAKERQEMTQNIGRATKEHENIRKKLKEFHPFNSGVRITKNDVVKYRLYEELACNGYKTWYTNTYVDKGKLFTKEFDIEHIIPKARLFDDSFSNKTLATRDFNRYKSNKTGIDAVLEKYGDDSDNLKRYVQTVEKLGKEKKITKAKYNKLLLKEEKIPDGFIDRDLRNTQYIAKKAQQMLLEVTRTVIPTTGSITDKLREDWQLIDVLKELNWDKYYQLGLTETEQTKDGKTIKKIKDWTKRNDHRHHAMDALTVAFTKYNHIQYFNYLNARRDEKHKKHNNIFAIENKETYVNDKSKRLVKPPMPLEDFRKEAKKHLEQTLVSFKAKNKVVTRNKNKTQKKGGYNTNTELTPRGQLHKETIYGSSKFYETKLEKVGGTFNEEKIKTVAKKAHRDALLKRLEVYGNDPKKAFTGKNSMLKNPIYLDEYQYFKIPEKVKLVTVETQYTIRKDINPDFKIEKVVDKAAKKELQKRLDEFGGDYKKAFVNLEENPIWLNKEKGIQLKRVTITGVSTAEALHHKKDHHGKLILDPNNKPIPTDFVSTGNNHHVAIYKDKEGNLHDYAVSFVDAVKRKINKLPVVPKLTKDLWNIIFEKNITDENFLKSLPKDNLELMFSMKQNEYFVFPNPAAGFDPSTKDLTNQENYALISPNLFRIQKLSKGDYFFRHHLETTVEDSNVLKGLTFKRIQSKANLVGLIKVRLNHLGFIVKVGE